MVTEVLMPRQGQSVESCIITGWSVAEGGTIKEGETICEIETDKAAFEVESPASGTVLGVFYPVDSDVEVLNTDLHIATLEDDATLIMEIGIAKGRGYVPAEEHGAGRVGKHDWPPVARGTCGSAGLGDQAAGGVP